MSNVTSRSGPSRTFACRAISLVAEAAGAAWSSYLRHCRELHGLARLSAMDDHELRDIGISRCEIRAAMWSEYPLRRQR
jgi:uncharacterized protein YjiS (DUF1127 family)